MFAPEDTELSKALIEFALADKRGPARTHITRVSMHMALENLVLAEDDASKTCLCISHSHPLAEVMGTVLAKRIITAYPEVNMLALPYEDASFDFVVSDQVLEHVEGDPFRAVAESVRVAKPGGVIVHTSCFMNFMHMLPLDFWRFTPQSLELLMKQAGAEVIKAGGWGNRAAWTYMQLGYRGRKVPEVAGNPIYELAIRNEKKWPVHTWVAARKPAARKG
ncbi:methyltransferase domain-containing protein [Reyranella sp.]|uniref:methyltransferase domain-containing protein n=1 Tax=Reyranella sp. TaxID=1929291 RepID=UPI003D097CE4